jgi:23S rRNA (cytosine1962-C5)-methyltransferase
MGSSGRIVLKPGRERSLRLRHPWVFSGAIDHVEQTASPGETVDVVDASGAFLARAAYSPSSQIRARVWSFNAESPIDRDFLTRRLDRAIEARGALGLLAATRGACRLVFAEADGMPGLIVDRYADYLVCQFLSVGPERWRATIVECLAKLLAPTGIFERSEAGSRRKEGLASRQGVLEGAAPPQSIVLLEDDIESHINIAHGQKTGGYLDQRFNRQRVSLHADGANVLDAFAYSGGFAMACLKKGARTATLVDSSKEALRLARENAHANGVDERCAYIEHDVFETLRELHTEGRRFDLIVLDPPKFVHSAAQIKPGSRGYKDINRLALTLVASGGVLATFSCSGHVDAALFQKIVAGAALDARREVQIIERLGQPGDHPVALSFPEGEYLKGLILRVW